MSKYFEQYNQGVDRVSGLLALYEKLADRNMAKANGSVRPSDILRAAVVFLHSAEEDYFRNILIRWYPEKADSKALQEIPLAGTTGRSQKYSFDQIACFRGQTIDELVIESVKQFFSKASFNSYGEIVSRLAKIQIDCSAYDRAADIDAFISRRHKIVHEVDLVPGKNHPTTKPISASQVRTWVECSMAFVKLIDAQVSSWDKASS